jgi:nitrogen regulatory protein PII
MSYLVVLVINDPDDCPALLDAWEELGVKGITLLESSGLGRIRQAGRRDDLPLMPSLHDLFSSEEVRHRTMFSVVSEKSLVDQIVSTTQHLMGDLDEPNSGFLFVVPVVEAYGLGRNPIP